MRKILNTEIMTYDELSPEAQAVARQWHREGNFDYPWHDYVYDDAKTIAGLMGIAISKIYFSGFCSQGDGACFECTFEGKEGAAQAVKEHAPLDTELHAIAAAWEALQKAADYKLTGGSRQQGHYSHEQCTRIWVEREALNDNDKAYEFDTNDSIVSNNDEPGAEAARILRRLMKWIYRQLEKEFEHMNSDAVVSENILANDYTFTINGKREG